MNQVNINFAFYVDWLEKADLCSDWLESPLRYFLTDT